MAEPIPEQALMSDATSEKRDLFKFVNVIDSRVDLEGKRMYPITKSNASINQVQLPAQSATLASTKWATNDITQNFRISNVYLSGYLYFNIPVNVSVQVPIADRGTALQLRNGIDFGVSPHPFWRCINNGNCLINDVEIENKEMYQHLPLLERLINGQMNNKYSPEPSALPYARNINDAFLTGFNNLAAGFDINPNNWIPNGSYPVEFANDAGDGSYSSTIPTFNNAVFQNAGAILPAAIYNLPARIKFNCRVPFAPFIYNEDENVEYHEQALSKIKNIKLSLTMNNGAEVFRLYDVANVVIQVAAGTGRYLLGNLATPNTAGTQTSLATLNSANPYGPNSAKPNLNYTCIEVPESNVMSAALMKSITPIYSFEVSLKQFPVGALAQGGTKNLNSDLINLTRVPSMIYAVATIDTLAVNQNRFFFPLYSDPVNDVGSVSIKWNNHTSRLYTASTYDHYKMMLKNTGCQQDYLSWSGRAAVRNLAVDGGSVVSTAVNYIPLVGGFCSWKPGFDFETSITESCNAEVNVNLQISNYTVVNTGAALPPNSIINFYVFCMYNDAMVINPANLIVEKMTGIVTPQMILDTDARAPAVTENQIVGNMVGGSLMHKMRNAFRKVKQVASSVVDSAPGVASAVVEAPGRAVMSAKSRVQARRLF